MAYKLSRRIQQEIEGESALFQWGGNARDAVLLVLDRCDDPVTPLLTQWTYQAMVHELLGLKCHRVDLSGAPGIKRKDLREVVLSPKQDTFFRQQVRMHEYAC